MSFTTFDKQSNGRRIVVVTAALLATLSSCYELFRKRTKRENPNHNDNYRLLSIVAGSDEKKQ